MTAIAIAMATFNGSPYVAEQLASIAAQSVHPAELVIVDDGSSDGTVEIIENFCRQVPFPTKFYQNTKRIGYRTSFIKAANLCSGDVIAFCDQDDIWEPTKIQILQLIFSESAETLLVYHNSLIVDRNNAPLTTTLPRKLASRTFNELEFSPCTTVPSHAQAFRRSLNRLSELHSLSVDPYAPNELMPHDMWIPFWASTLGKVQYIPDVLVRYRMHERNTSGWHLTWWSFAADHIQNAKLYVRANEIIAKNRESLLKRARALLDRDANLKLEAGSAFYNRLKAQSTQRITIHESASLFSRFRAFLRFVWHGNYQKGAHCHGLDALLLDLGVGVLRVFPKRLKS